MFLIKSVFGGEFLVYRGVAELAERPHLPPPPRAQFSPLGEGVKVFFPVTQYGYMITEPIFYSAFLSFPPVPFLFQDFIRHAPLHSVLLLPSAHLDSDHFSDLPCFDPHCFEQGRLAVL